MRFHIRIGRIGEQEEWTEIVRADNRVLIVTESESNQRRGPRGGKVWVLDWEADPRSSTDFGERCAQ